MAPQTASAHSEAVHNLSLLPACEYRRTQLAKPRKLPSGLDAFSDRLVGMCRRRSGLLVQLRREAEAVDRLAAAWQHVSDHRLREKLVACGQAFRRQNSAQAEAALPEALAAIREAAERQLGLRPFVVQIMGALALYRGYLAEMATGEGKTLTAGLAAVLAGWTGRPCHIVTANDYLAERDAGWLNPLYRFCGMSAGFIAGNLEPRRRAEAYAHAITYCTSKELTADFLRDRLHLGALHQGERRHIRRLLGGARPGPDTDRMVMRGLHTAIVDEADSLLIDEAVTPLIISRPQDNGALKDACLIADTIAGELERGRDYEVTPRYKEVEITATGRLRLEAECARLPGIWRAPKRREELIRQALTAREFFRRDEQYLINDERKIVIVDEFTGRSMPERTWREGLHQAIEAKEKLPITNPSETLARLSFQRFFRLFTKLSGMTGTAREAAAELWHIYRLPVVTIPTNKPCVRVYHPDRLFADAAGKWQAVSDTIADLHRRGVPVLVGTRSIAASEHLAACLRERQLEFNLLNARHHREEAQIVAEAGLPGKITIATNMAGRGTDIRLAPGVAEQGGLRVMATERHDSGRIDRQLFGRCARQGDPGEVHVFVSAEDELLVRFAPRSMRLMLASLVRTNPASAQRFAGLVFALAQRRAQRQAYRQRQQVLRTDSWLDEALSFAGSEAL